MSPVSVFNESLVVLQPCQWLTPALLMLLSIAKSLWNLKGTNHTWRMFSGKQLFSLTFHFPAKSTSRPPLHTHTRVPSPSTTSEMKHVPPGHRSPHLLFAWENASNQYLLCAPHCPPNTHPTLQTLPLISMKTRSS